MLLLGEMAWRSDGEGVEKQRRRPGFQLGRSRSPQFNEMKNESKKPTTEKSDENSTWLTLATAPAVEAAAAAAKDGVGG